MYSFSVSKLTEDLNYCVTFTNALCVIQDSTSRILIGAGEKWDGAYVFRTPQRARACCTSGLNERELWHRRLGHPAQKLLSFIPLIRSMIENSSSSEHCDVCLRARQTREVFSISNNIATDCFSLIHIDLWGPYRTHSTCGAVYFLTIVDDFSRAVWVYLLLDREK